MSGPIAMKFLAVLFLAGLALAYAVPVPSHEEDSLDDVDELDYLFDALPFDPEDYDKSELEEKVREYVDFIQERIKDAVENGKGLNEDFTQKLKETREKMNQARIDLGEAEELLEKIEEKGYWKRILGRLVGVQERSVKDDVRQKLRELYNKFMDRIKESLEKGKEVSERYINKLKEIREKFGGNTGELDKKAKDYLDRLTGKVRDAFQKILDKIGVNTNSDDVEYAEGDLEEVKKDLREAYERILERIKVAVEKGKEVEEKTLDKLKDIRKKLGDELSELNEKARDFLDRVKESAKDKYRRILERLGIVKDKRDISLKEYIDKMTELKLRRYRLLDLLLRRDKRIGEVFGKDMLPALYDISLQIIKSENVLNSIDKLIGDKESEKRSVKDVYEKIKNYFRDFKIELKEKFSKFGEYAKEKYEKVLESGKDRVENLKKLAREFISDGRVISKDVAKQAKGFFQEYRNDLGVIYDEVKEKVRDILNKN